MLVFLQNGVGLSLSLVSGKGRLRGEGFDWDGNACVEAFLLFFWHGVCLKLLLKVKV